MSQEKEELIKRIFSTVSPHIDFLSSLFSLGLDIYWRRRLLSYINKGDNVLDVCTGTGRLAFLVSKRIGDSGSVIGIDINPDMIKRAQKKISPNPGNLTFMIGDSKNLPFSDSSIDAITMAFGIRNIVDRSKALKECYRVLRPGGRFLCLELMKPANRFFRPIWRFYLFKVIPFIGGLVTGDPIPYRYLPASIEGFYSVDGFKDLLVKHGFRVKEIKSMTCGTTNLFVALKE